MEKSKREINIEVLRIIAMLMVIGIHCIGHTKILEMNILTPINDFLCRYFKLLINVANSVFIIITGYYSINKGLNLKRIIFYSLLIFVIVNILGFCIDPLSSLLPVLAGNYWFITAYIALSFIYPFYNILLRKLDKRKWKTLIIIIFTISIVKFIFSPNGIFENFTTVILMYTIGGYIKNFVEINKNKKYLTKYFLSLDFKSAKPVINNLFFGFQNLVNPFTTVMTVYLFLKFRTIEVKDKQIQKLITYISPSLFSVYVIHENINLKVLWVFSGMFELIETPFFMLYLLLLIILVFFICIIIDLIRRFIYTNIKKIPIINKQVDKINVKIESIQQKIGI